MLRFAAAFVCVGESLAYREDGGNLTAGWEAA